MGTMVVVQEYRFLDNLAYLLDIPEVAIQVELCFYYTIDPYSPYKTKKSLA